MLYGILFKLFVMMLSTVHWYLVVCTCTIYPFCFVVVLSGWNLLLNYKSIPTLEVHQETQAYIYLIEGAREIINESSDSILCAYSADWSSHSVGHYVSIVPTDNPWSFEWKSLVFWDTVETPSCPYENTLTIAWKLQDKSTISRATTKYRRL